MRYEYPEELAPPGQTPLEYLTQLTWAGARRRYPRGIPDKVRSLVEHELRLIAELRYEAYFLTVYDLVRFARERDILCQGRGSAANSAVCYCLGVTAVDPDRLDVLFERFVSRERNEAPDIDIDFEHERREEVLQYLYDKYGRERAGMTAEVITYRPRSAVRDVGKALGLSLDRVDALAKSLEGHHLDDCLPERCRDVGIDPASLLGGRLIALVGELVGFPRHLGQHVGGMVMTQGPLCELVPIENAAMADRTVIEWDKDDLDELGILKVDCLSLGMLTAIRKCFALVAKHTGRELSLASIPEEDPAVYDMIGQADTMGVFQIESRAQMSMLPRLQPRVFYDLVIEVAIVRPGPIQGNMVHPYLRRRLGEEAVTYPNDEIRDVLKRTLGVPLFQEQAMRLAVVAAGFTPGEADQLRRAMGAWRRPGIIEQFRQKLIEGMQRKGLSRQFAENVFRQISGFGEYGFPESHAASFALLVYVSAWLKHYYPAAFCAALFNSQPMGFYAPAQLVCAVRVNTASRCAPVDVNASRWDCTLEDGALRLGLRMVSGLSEAHARRIEATRSAGPFLGWDDFARRTELTRAVVSRLAAADAFASLSLDRRGALWQALGREKKPRSLPLFDQLAPDDEPAVPLPRLDVREEVLADYRTAGLSLKAHPMQFVREVLDGWGVLRASALATHPADRHVRTGRHRAGAAAPQHGQRHHVRHARRRNRHGQPDHPPGRVAKVLPRGPHRLDLLGPRPPAAPERRDPRASDQAGRSLRTAARAGPAIARFPLTAIHWLTVGSHRSAAIGQHGRQHQQPRDADVDDHGRSERLAHRIALIDHDAEQVRARAGAEPTDHVGEADGFTPLGRGHDIVQRRPDVGVVDPFAEAEAGHGNQHGIQLRRYAAPVDERRADQQSHGLHQAAAAQAILGPLIRQHAADDRAHHAGHLHGKRGPSPAEARSARTFRAKRWAAT